MANQFLTRPGTSGRGQQVWKHWDFATDEEKRVTMEENKNDPLGGRWSSRGKDHMTAKAAIRAAEATRLENMVATVLWNLGFKGGTWDEVCKISGLGARSVSPRWSPLRHRLVIVYALKPQQGNLPLVRAAE